MEFQLNREIDVRFIAPARWWKQAQWKLLEDYTSANGNVTVKKGFVSDGASIAWFLRWLFSPTGQYFGAAIVHDYIICSEKDWRKANREFRAELDALGIPGWRRRIMHLAVRCYSKLKGLS